MYQHAHTYGEMPIWFQADSSESRKGNGWTCFIHSQLLWKGWDLKACMSLALNSSVLSSPSLPRLCVTAAFGALVNCSGVCCNSWGALPPCEGIATAWVSCPSTKFLQSLPPSQPLPFLFNNLFGHSKERDKNKISLGSNCITNNSHLLLLCHLLCSCDLHLPLHLCCLFRQQALGGCLPSIFVQYQSPSLLLTGFWLLPSQTWTEYEVCCS